MQNEPTHYSFLVALMLLLLLFSLLFDRKEEDVVAVFGGKRMGDGNKDELECYVYVASATYTL